MIADFIILTCIFKQQNKKKQETALQPITMIAIHVSQVALVCVCVL